MVERRWAMTIVCAAVGDLCQTLLDGGFGFVVHTGGCFVQNEDGGVFQEGPGQADALALAAGEFFAPLADDGIVAPGQGVNKTLGLGKAGCSKNLLIPRAGIPISDVLPHRAMKKKNVLVHKGNSAYQVPEPIISNINTIQAEPPTAHIVETEEELDEAGLPHPRGPHNANRPPRANLKIQISQDIAAT